MADMTGRDRGQIILVAAFALAVIFLTLALVVNSAIFTENLASRSDTTGSDDALTNRAVVEQNVGEAMASANRNNPGSLVSTVQTNIQAFQSRTGQQQAMSGQLVDVEYTSSTNGERVDYDGGLFSDGASSSYSLATDIQPVTDGNGTREFTINATSLPSASDPPFTVTLDDGTVQWVTQIWNDGGTIRVLSSRSDAAVNEDCGISAVSGSTQRIDLTEGTINGEPCDALGKNETGAHYHFGAGVTNTYSIEFDNASQISGDFTVVVRPDTSANSFTTPTGAGPEDALYDVTVEYSYTTNDVRYVTDIRVAPGEPDA